MQQIVITTGMLIGGLGLFLLAVNMITDGLRLAADKALRNVLGKATRSSGRGIISGVSITAIVQSSGAVTIATIGFVNAGLISMYQALGVIYGANIGTTATGWLVALIGFNIKIEALALPLVGLGMILRVTGGESRRAPLGLALAGFGLFFVGIDVLREAFAGLVTTIDLQRITADGVSGIVLFVTIGFLMTVFTQSSSAAIAITLTAATNSVVGPYAAAAMIIGANIGTTSTAIFAVIGATSNAKRVAAAHVIFNLVTGIVALILLPVMFGIVKAISSFGGMQDIPVVTLAMFHTAFNILGVMLMWPITEKLAEALRKRFTSQEEIDGRPQYLDKTVAVSPTLALNALGLELARVGSIARRMSKASLSQEQGVSRLLKADRSAILALVRKIGDFVSHLERSTMPTDISTELPKVLRTSQYYIMTADLVREIAIHKAAVGEIINDKLNEKIANFKLKVVQLLDATDVQVEGFSIDECNKQLEELNAIYEDLKVLILETGTESGVDINTMSALLEQNSNIRRFVTQMVKAARYLSALFIIAQYVKPAEISEPASAAENA